MQKWIRHLSIVLFLFSVGCAGWLKRGQVSDSSEEVGAEVPDNVQQALEKVQSEYGKVELVVNKHVMKWINYYQGRGRKHMDRYLERSTRYVELMREVLREEGLPEDLVYLPIVESGFSSSAHSFASAVGYWQFIRSTGKRYGLEINPYLDERRDPEASTRAAARYLKALYNLFGDWYLALAAYNTGENRVKRAVMKYGTRDFWDLAKKRRLHRETRDYVPKYLAALIIAKDPERFGFNNVDYSPKLSFDSIPTFKSISLEKLAKNMGLSYDELKNLNPKYRSDFVPVENGQSAYLRVPKGSAQTAVAALDSSVAEAPKHIPNDYFWYKVRRGDTLSEIAQKYRTNISTLRRLNNMGRRSFIRVGQKVRVPDRGISVLRRNHRTVAVSSSSDGLYHTVRRGENLTLIAQRYGISISTLMRLNHLGSRSLIRAGQKLKIREDSTGDDKSSGNGRKSRVRSVYIVKRGDNLTEIARKYGVSLNQLRRWNGLGSRSMIRVGQKIKLKSTSRNLVHVVRRGENLSLIASKYDVSISDIARINDLKSRSTIYVGHRLVIPQ